MLAGLLAGAIQNRFNTASEALTPNWNRLNPVEGFKRLFSVRMVAAHGHGHGQTPVIIALTYSEIRSILNDPIFTTSVSVARMAEFLAQTCMRIFFRVSLALLVIAAADYGYQWWRNQQDLMMTQGGIEGGNEKHRRQSAGQSRAPPPPCRQQSQDARRSAQGRCRGHQPDAHRRRVAIRPQDHARAQGGRQRHPIERGTASAKSRAQHQVPILENKPLARMLFKHGRVGGEIPAQLYAAVAEVLAWVYRVNRYRYYAEQNQA